MSSSSRSFLRKLSGQRSLAAPLVACALAFCTGCGGGPDLDGPAVPAQFTRRAKWMVEYQVPPGLPSLLEVECTAGYGTRDIMDGGGVPPERTSLHLNAEELADHGILAKVLRGGVEHQKYLAWAWAGKGATGKIILADLGLSLRQTAELSRDRILAGLKKAHVRTPHGGPPRASDIERIPSSEYVVKAEVVVALGDRIKADRGLPSMVLETDRPLRETVTMRVRSLGDGVIRVEAPLGAECRSSAPR